MSQKYFDENGKEMSKELFDRDREKLLARRLKAVQDPDNLIPYEELEYYLDELEKYWE